MYPVSVKGTTKSKPRKKYPKILLDVKLDIAD